MNRNTFLKRIVQLVLFGILAVIAILLGNRAVSGDDCSSCSGKGICNGEIDCSKFKVNNDGRA
jgi:hypothetical protein